MELQVFIKNKIVTKVATIPFSSKRLLLADFSAAELLIKSLLKEVFGNSRFGPTIIMLIQPICDYATELSQVEIRSFIDSGWQAGAKDCYIFLRHQNRLTEEEIKEFIKSKTAIHHVFH